MNDRDLTITFSVDQTPEQAFAAIRDVRSWWSQAAEGSTDRVGDEFSYRYQDLHQSRHRLVELIPGQKLVWLVVDADLSFVENRSEWKGTRLCFELSRRDDRTEVRFTHLGLAPQQQCYDACSRGWTYYINESLRPLITTGKGRPDPLLGTALGGGRVGGPSAAGAGHHQVDD
jgi:hypothetical protein